MQGTIAISDKILNEISSSFDKETKEFVVINDKKNNNYIFTCNDPVIKSMALKLKPLYKDINNSYEKMNHWLKDFTKNYTQLEKSLSTGSNSAADGNVRGYLQGFVGDLNFSAKKVSQIFSDVPTEIHSSSSQYNSEGTSDAGVLKRTFATGAYFSTELAKSLFNLGNNIATGCKIIHGKIKSGQQIDPFKFLEEIKEEVKEEGNFWDNYYEDFYSNTSEGRFIRDNCYKREFVEGASNFIGTIGGVSALTAGAGYIIGAATGVAVTATVSKVIGAVIMGMSTFGATAKEAYNKDATFDEGMKAGTIKGVAEGATCMFIGRGSSSKKRVLNDAGLGGALTLIDTLAEAFYEKGYTNENGEYIEFADNTKFTERYKKLFESNGGWKSVGIGASVGGAMSAFGEALTSKSRNSITTTAREKMSGIKESASKLKQKFNLKSTNPEKISGIKKLSKIPEKIKESILAQKEKFKIFSEESEKLQDEMLLQYQNLRKKAKESALKLKQRFRPTSINDSVARIEETKSLFKIISEEPFNYDEFKNISNNIENYEKNIRKYVEYTLKKHPEWNYNADDYFYNVLNNANNGNFTLISREYRNQFINDFELLNKNMDKKIIYGNELKKKLINEGYSSTQVNYWIDNNIDDVFDYYQRNKYDLFLENFRDDKNLYGVDQGVINKLYYYEDKITGEKFNENQLKNLYASQKKNLKKVGSEEYFRLKNKYQSQGYSSRDISKIMSGLDSKGACSYANISNEIFMTFKDNPEEFRKIFGFDMFVEINGKKTLNSSELLLDMYVFTNDVKNGGNLISNNRVISDSLDVDIFGRNMLDAKGQKGLSGIDGISEERVNNYFKSKNSSLKFNTRKIVDHVYDGDFYNPQPNSLNQIKEYGNLIQRHINEGKQCHLGFYSTGDEIFMHSLDTKKISSTRTWSEGGGHAVYITKTTDEGLIVSSWGEKYLIPYESLTNNSSFVITSSEITNFR